MNIKESPSGSVINVCTDGELGQEAVLQLSYSLKVDGVAWVVYGRHVEWVLRGAHTAGFWHIKPCDVDHSYTLVVPAWCNALCTFQNCPLKCTLPPFVGVVPGLGLLYPRLPPGARSQGSARLT